ncbi:MAG TPA: hypothetical protein VGK50_02330 [Coriobacteriia bacterium]|jgi:hypothetical protein
MARWGVAVLLVATVLAGQAAADRLLPRTGRTDAGRLAGRTGFAYLTGIRTYVAAVLWARLDPVNDTYYNKVPLGQKKFLLPTISIVNWLDPDMQEPYYVGPFVLYEAGLKRNAILLAERGARNNPKSAFLHASFAQLLLAEGRMADARREADVALTSAWTDPSDEYQLLSALEVIFNKTGAPGKAALVVSERKRLEATFNAEVLRPDKGD